MGSSEEALLVNQAIVDQYNPQRARRAEAEGRAVQREAVAQQQATAAGRSVETFGGDLGSVGASLELAAQDRRVRGEQYRGTLAAAAGRSPETFGGDIGSVGASLELQAQDRRDRFNLAQQSAPSSGELLLASQAITDQYAPQQVREAEARRTASFGYDLIREEIALGQLAQQGGAPRTYQPALGRGTYPDTVSQRVAAQEELNRAYGLIEAQRQRDARNFNPAFADAVAAERVRDLHASLGQQIQTAISLGLFFAPGVGGAGRLVGPRGLAPVRPPPAPVPQRLYTGQVSTGPGGGFRLGGIPSPSYRTTQVDLGASGAYRDLVGNAALPPSGGGGGVAVLARPETATTARVVSVQTVRPSDVLVGRPGLTLGPSAPLRAAAPIGQTAALPSGLLLASSAPLVTPGASELPTAAPSLESAPFAAPAPFASPTQAPFVVSTPTAAPSVVAQVSPVQVLEAAAAPSALRTAQAQVAGPQVGGQPVTTITQPVTTAPPAVVTVPRVVPPETEVITGPQPALRTPPAVREATGTGTGLGTRTEPPPVPGPQLEGLAIANPLPDPLVGGVRTAADPPPPIAPPPAPVQPAATRFGRTPRRLTFPRPAPRRGGADQRRRDRATARRGYARVVDHTEVARVRTDLDTGTVAIRPLSVSDVRVVSSDNSPPTLGVRRASHARLRPAGRTVRGRPARPRRTRTRAVGNGPSPFPSGGGRR